MKILFVCTANICRSAFCEAVLKQKLKEKRITGVEIMSAGVCYLEGEPRDSTMTSYALESGYKLTGEARFVSQEMIDSADWIICMEHYHVVEIQKRLAYAQWKRIRLFNEICYDESTNVPDPSGDTNDMYISVLKHLEVGCEKLIARLFEEVE